MPQVFPNNRLEPAAESKQQLLFELAGESAADRLRWCRTLALWKSSWGKVTLDGF